MVGGIGRHRVRVARARSALYRGRGEWAMAEPADSGLGYLAQFDSLSAIWAAHEDRRHKFHGIVDRIDVLWDSFDWKANRFPAGGAVPGR